MELDINEMVQRQIVADVLAKIPTDQRDALLEKTMTKSLESVFNKFNVEGAIRVDAERYMAEYIKKPESQAKIKAGVEEAFDRIISNMVTTFEKRIDETLSSNYVSFARKSK